MNQSQCSPNNRLLKHTSRIVAMKITRLLSTFSLLLGTLTITHAQTIVFDLDGWGLYGNAPLDLSTFTDINGQPQPYEDNIPPVDVYGLAELTVAATTID